jgi:hypothetical protein
MSRRLSAEEAQRHLPLPQAVFQILVALAVRAGGRVQDRARPPVSPEAAISAVEMW